MIIDEIKKKGVELDTELSADDLKQMVGQFKALIRSRLGREFPNDPWEQLWGAVMAVFASWNNDRAKLYRQMNDIPDAWGTAVNVQSMVSATSATTAERASPLRATRLPAKTSSTASFGQHAQGEDVVAGIRTPQQVTLEGSRRWAELAQVSEAERATKYPSLEELMPRSTSNCCRPKRRWRRITRTCRTSNSPCRKGKLWLLQTRSGKRAGPAMVRIAVEMLKQGLIDEKTALLRVAPDRLNELLHPVFDPLAVKRATSIAHGTPASPSATGQIVFFADEAEDWVNDGKDVILVRQGNLSRGFARHGGKGILTARGGMTSHAAVVARGMGKCCVSGAGAVRVDPRAR